MKKTSNLMMSQSNSDELILHFGVVQEEIINDVNDENATFIIHTSHDDAYTPLAMGTSVAPAKAFFGLVKDNRRRKELWAVKKRVKCTLYLETNGFPFTSTYSAFNPSYELVLTVICNNPLQTVKARRINVKKIFTDRINEIKSLISRMPLDNAKDCQVFKNELNKMMSLKARGLYIVYVMVNKTGNLVEIHNKKSRTSKRRHTS